MKSIILKSFVWWLTFFFTIILCFVWYASWVNLTEVEEEHTLTTWRWNEMVTKLNSVWNKVETFWNLPTWAVIAFNLTTCPTWWSEYIPARWRFIRWIDSTWTNDVVRNLWSLQTDSTKLLMNWSVNWTNPVANPEWNSPSWIIMHKPNVEMSWIQTGFWWEYSSKFSLRWAMDTNWWWSSETRPKNVALLYCEKE